jgi:hypothetical protein
MKTGIKIMALVLLIAFTGSCYINTVNTITGNRNVIKQDRQVADFNKIKVATGIDVVITQGNNESLTVEADENLHEWIKTEISDSTLKIYCEKTIRSAEKKVIYLGYKTLRSIDISSAGDVTATNTLVGDALEIDMSSAGNLSLALETGRLDINISSAGNATLSGKTGYFMADLSSAGDLNAFELEAEVGDISVSSAGSARVFITGEASFQSSSAGDIDYKGEPRIKSMNSSSAGSINKK